MFGIPACECVCLLWPSNKPHLNQWLEDKHCCSLAYSPARWFYWSRLCCSPHLVWLCSCICNQAAPSWPISGLVNWGLLDLEWPHLHGLLVTMEMKVLDLYVYMVAWADSHGRPGLQERQMSTASWGLALRQTDCHFHSLWSYPIDQSNSQDQFRFNGGQISPTS